jgi:chromosome segregation ATPase
MEKGKGMIKEMKEKFEKEKADLDDDVAYLTNKIMQEEEDKKRLGIQFQTKIVEYKKKLQAATGRINTLSSENNEIEENLKRMERERNKLRDENDRYRRQIGGRSGSDSVLQNQMELLQKEFQNAVDENRELKRKLQSQGQSALSSIGEEVSVRYTRGRTNQQSTLVQLRSEYEETIESLNDEKRELIMKNSAALTDVKKAEKRAWQVEQENARLKQDLTSLKLSNERLEGQLSSVQENSENFGQASTYGTISISEMSSIPQPPSDLGDDSVTGKAAGESFSNKDGVLSSKRDHANTAFAKPASVDKYSSAGREEFTSPDLATKRWVQSTSLHTPYRSHKGTNDPPEGKKY